MKTTFISLLSVITLAVFTSGTGIPTINDLPARQLTPIGRYAFSDDGLELLSSAAHVGFTFEGKECKVFADINYPGGHNYLQYDLDGQYQKRVKISGDDPQPFTISASKNGTHTVWLYKATEAHTGPVFIEKISGKNVKPLKPVKAPLIEFIGNSITCGAAADPSDVPCGTGEYHDQHNAYYAYGPRVARALKTNFILSSVSGIGIYRNWNSDGPTMPQVYEMTDFQDGNARHWDFKTYSPDIVSIALGTNDYSDGDGKRERKPFDSASFVSNYITFVRLVKSKYPEARIALLSSPMINGDRRITLQNCLIGVKENIDQEYPSDPSVSLHFFSPMQPRGCSYHPSVDDHAILAEELTPFFKEML